jgi:hypothetical protein
MQLYRNTRLLILFAAMYMPACAPDEGESAPGPAPDAPEVRPPADPDSTVTISVVAPDGAGGWKVTAHEKITKREQWLQRDAMLNGRSVSSGIESVSSAATIEACWHGSNVVLFDGLYLSGNAICVQWDGTVTTPADLFSVDPNFRSRSYYTVVPIYFFDTNGTKLATWCQWAYQYDVDVSDLNPVRYVQTNGKEVGICRFN